MHEEQVPIHPSASRRAAGLAPAGLREPVAPESALTCATCGAERLAGHLFCHACGARHHSPITETHPALDPQHGAPPRRGLGAPPRHLHDPNSHDGAPSASSAVSGTGHHAKRVRRRRRRERWPRRHPMLTGLLLLVLIGAAAVAFIAGRAASTVETIQSMSTPPAEIALIPEQDDPSATEGPSITINTEPARAAIATSQPEGSQGDDGGFFSSISSSASGFNDAVLGAADAAGVTESDLEPLTILLMGVDARPGEAIDVGVRPDALAVMRLDPAAGTCRLLNIPRDSRVDLPGYGLTKINHALAVGGIPYQQLVVEQFLGISIDRYALTDFGGIVTLVDSLGGVTITVTEPFTFGGYTFETGPRALNGDEALVYARYRYGPDGDFGRIRRQQQILRALLNAAVNEEPLTLIRDVLPELQEHIRTDLSPRELVALGTEFRGVCTEETLVTLSLEGTVATYDDPLFQMPLSYVVVTEDEVRRKVEELFQPESAS